MPYISQSIKLPQEYDRRRKLMDYQKDEIRHKYSLGAYSLNSLAKEYHVSKKTILLTVNPESKKKNDQRMKEHWKDYKAPKEERAAIVREYRHYKEKLYRQGKLVDNDNSKKEV